MSTVTYSKGSGGSSQYHRQTLFLASCISLIATAMAFAVGGAIEGPLQSEFHFSFSQSGAILGAISTGYTISLLIGAQLCDLLGMKRLLALAFVAHVTAISLTLTAHSFWPFWLATVGVGIGNGFVEASINPLIATLYSDDKAHRLNRLHVWFPGGQVIGGLLAFAVDQYLGKQVSPHLLWQLKIASIYIPTILYGLTFLRLNVPPTERAQSQVTTKEMYMEFFRPAFLAILFCMLLTASTELTTGRWIAGLLQGATNNPVLVIVWVGVIMAIGRRFAGPVVHKFSPTGMLLGSSVLALIGLLGLSMAHGPVQSYGAAAIFAAGVCYFWPTMLGLTSERFPKGGSFLLGMMGAAGMISVSLTTWLLGVVIDTTHLDPQMGLRYIATFPAILIVMFGIMYAGDKSRGGYKPEVLSADTEAAKAGVGAS